MDNNTFGIQIFQTWRHKSLQLMALKSHLNTVETDKAYIVYVSIDVIAMQRIALNVHITIEILMAPAKTDFFKSPRPLGLCLDRNTPRSLTVETLYNAIVNWSAKSKNGFDLEQPYTHMLV